MADPKTPKVGFGAYIALALAIIIFSGVFYKMPDAYKWLGAFDYTTLIGKYGTIAGTASNFQGSGGFSARAGFLFSLNLFPGVMLAMGLIEVLSFYGALRAAQVILTPLLTRALHDEGRITTKNLVTICAWQYTGAGCVSNYYSTVSGLFTLFTVKVWIPMALILVLKFVGGALIRTILSTVYRKDFEND